MKILLLVMFALGLVSTHDNDAFKSAVHDNYQYYQEIIAEETTAVRINVFLGLIGEQFSLSIFYENVSSSQSHHLVLISEGKTSSLASSNSRGYFYQRKVGKGTKVELQVVTSTQSTLFKQYDIDIPSDINDFKQVAIQGKDLNEFPASTWTIKFSTLLVVGILIFMGISLLFVFILIIVFRKKKGIFSPQAIEQRRKNFEYIFVDQTPDSEAEVERRIWEIDPADYSVDYEEKKTKEEQIDDLFKAYKAGKISENDLNAALRSIWAEEDDEDENY